MNKEVAELYLEIEKIKIQTEKVDKLNHLAYSIRYSSPADSSKYAYEALKIARKEKYKTGTASSLTHLAFANFLMSADYPVLQHLVDAHGTLSEINKIPKLLLY